MFYVCSTISKFKLWWFSGSGELEFEEFCMLSARFLVEEDAEAMQQELREAFRLYDKEGNGYITTDVLREILRELDDKVTKEDLDMMIEEIDSDGSGTVDFDGETFLLIAAHYFFQCI
jgi:calmodulin